jgi:cell division protein FtsI (penicillin-binding protein 3)
VKLGSSRGGKPPPGTTDDAQKWLNIRLILTGVVVTVLFGLIAHTAWSVQIRQGEHLLALGEAQYLRDLELPAPRGSILDRQGVPLAVSVEVQSVYVRPRDLTDPRAEALDLARLLELDAAVLTARFTAGKPFVWVKRRVTPDQAHAIASLHLPGVGMTPEAKRFYPAGNLAGPVLGAAGIDGHGVDGLEKSLDRHLLGEVEKHQVLRDARGHVLFDGGWNDDAATASAGDTVTLTIDRNVQYVAEQALADGVERTQARSGVAVVLDVATGQVLAMASSPTFDPNGSAGRDGARNRPVTDVFEPGSVMKVFTIASGLESGAVGPNDSWAVDGGRLMIGRHTLRDAEFWKPILSTGEVLKISSNVGAVKIARKTGKEALAAGLRSFGFGVPTGIELPGERSGTLTDSKRWGEARLATIAYGYGLTVTPLQVAAGLAAIATGGVYHAPRIVRDIRAPDGHVIFTPEPVSRRVLSLEHARQLLHMLAMVMEEEGTGEKIKVPGFLVGGKTGTAYKIDPATHKYSTNHYLSSFVGIAPLDHPRIVVVVMIDDPAGRDHFGATVSGPVFASIVSQVLPYLGVAANPALVAAAAASTKVQPSRVHQIAEPELVDSVDAAAGEVAAMAGDAELDVSGDDGVPPAGPGEAIVVIPDFRGLSTTQAVAAARAAGVKLSMTGSGRVVSQFPPPGRAMKSITCQITFEPR